MKEEYELVEHIYKDASMATFTLTKLLKVLKEKDNKIKGTVEEILKHYESYVKEAKKELKSVKVKPSEEGMMAKMGASMGINKEVKADNSDASMAEMLIQGISMGSLEMEKKLKAYDKEVDDKHRKLAENFLTFQQQTIENLKSYL